MAMSNGAPEDDSFRRGERSRREVLGERSSPREGSIREVWRRFATEVAWGQVWARPGLDLRTRSICTISVLCALGELDQLKTHIPGALNLGVTREELAEILIHVGNYAGMPRASSAFEVAAEVLDGEPARPK
jgi:4-carboxymuconolactone decarboxylase